MARIFLNSGETAEIGSSQFSVVGNADSAETIKLPGNAKTTFDSSFARGGDIIEINGKAADYTMVREASNIRLTSASGAVIIIPVGPAGATIKFADVPARELVIEDGKFLLGGQDFTSGSVTVSGPTVPPVEPVIKLTVGADDLTGGAGNDVFEAKIIQNANGEQTNALGTGDSINGGAGDDKLSARVQDASPLNAGPGQAIAIDSTNVETLAFEAVQTSNAIFNNPDDQVDISAKNIYGSEQFESYYSDASLRIYDVNTLQNGGVDTYATRRNTESQTFVMDHTSGASEVENASDFIALFDNDYLLQAPPQASNSSITLRLLDIDNQIDSKQPLLTVPYDELYLKIDGVALPAITFDSDNDGIGIDAYHALAVEINKGLAAAGLTTFHAEVTTPFTVVDPDGVTNNPANNNKSAEGYHIVITDSAGSEIEIVGIRSSEIEPPNTDYTKEVFATPAVQLYNLITANLVVDKVGRGGEGGDFQVGAMSASTTHPSGIERFNLLVRGDASETSNVASVSSTNNYLREVYVTSDAGSGADLIIGNGQTDPSIYGRGSGNQNGSDSARLPNDADFRFDDVTTPKNYGLVDVQVFDASAFSNDLTLNAALTDDFTGKYLDLLDTDTTVGGRPTATADNVAALYTFAGGNDTLNINISQDNAAHTGATTREDFAFSAVMGAGDDTVEVQLGNGEASSASLLDGTDNWYVNHVINDNLSINTGAGDDFVNTWGASAARITLGDGDDLVYTDNSGTDDDVFNDDKATWVFNSKNTEANDLLTQTSGRVLKVANLTLTVQFQGVEVTVVVGDTNGNASAGYTVSDLDIVQALKKAVNTTILADFLTAVDGPSGTLLVESDIDGQVDVSDFTIRLGSNGSALSAAQASSGVRLFGTLTDAELANIGFLKTGWAIAGTPTAPGRFDSEFATDGATVLDGNDSNNLNNNRVYGGLGNDNIVLSSQNSSIEHVEYKRGEKFGFDTILNFTAASEEDVTENLEEIQEITIEGTANQASTITVTLLETTVTVDVPAGATADAIGELIETALNGAFADAGVDASANNVAGVVTATGPLGVNYSDPVVPVTQAAETQVITFTGAALTGEQVQITFDGTVATATLDAGETFADVLAELVTELNAGTQVATVVGNTITVVNNENGNIPPAIIEVTESAPGVGSNLGYTVTPRPEGANLGFTLEAATEQDGANVELGFDIFDLSHILGVAGPADVDFINDNPLASGNDYLDGHEHAAIDAGTLNRPSVFIVDTLEAGDWAGFQVSSTNELLRLTDIIKDADDTAHIGAAVHSVVITVDADNVGTFYQVTNGNGVGDATVTELGKVELGFYELDGKEAIGNWGQMTVDNFTSLTPTELVNVYGSSFGF